MPFWAGHAGLGVAGALVTGLDLSPVAIASARDLARRAGLTERSRFVCADVYEASEALGHTNFDIVYVNTGALCWLPSVSQWAAEIGALVAPGGRFFIHDGHPLAWALGEDRLEFERSYFEEREPLVDDSGYTYTDADGPLEATRSYEWNHGLGEIVTALVRYGLGPEWLVEHDWTDWPRFVAGRDGRRYLGTSAGHPAAAAQLQPPGQPSPGRVRKMTYMGRKPVAQGPVMGAPAPRDAAVAWAKSDTHPQSRRSFTENQTSPCHSLSSRVPGCPGRARW